VGDGRCCLNDVDVEVLNDVDVEVRQVRFLLLLSVVVVCSGAFS
jgi:hypothetical protein